VGGETSARRWFAPVVREHFGAAQLLGHRVAALLRRSGLGTLTFWLPLYLSQARHFDLKQIALFAWMPFLAADFGCLFGGALAMTLQPDLPPHPFPATPALRRFDTPELPSEFQRLRSPSPEEIFSLTARAGWLRLHGLESPGSSFRQSLVARRQQAHCCSAATRMEFGPENFQQMAGLIYYYNSAKFHYLYLSCEERGRPYMRVMSSLPDLASTQDVSTAIPIRASQPIELRAEVDYERLRFAFRVDGSDWNWLPQQFDASTISDEAGPPLYPNFTGAFIGMCCQDLAGTRRPADFEFFEYREREYSRIAE
jgi:xylan 1,4-beta-xylosidase